MPDKRSLEALSLPPAKIAKTTSIFQILPPDLVYFLLSFLHPKEYVPLLLLNRSESKFFSKFINALISPQLSALVKPKEFKSQKICLYSLFYKTGRVNELAKSLHKSHVSINELSNTVGAKRDSYLYYLFYQTFDRSELSDLAVAKEIINLHFTHQAENNSEEDDDEDENDTIIQDKFPIAHCLASVGNLDVTLYLIERGFDIDCKNEDDNTFIEMMFSFKDETDNLNMMIELMKRKNVSNQIKLSITTCYIQSLPFTYEDYAENNFNLWRTTPALNEKVDEFVEMLNEANASTLDFAFCEKFIELHAEITNLRNQSNTRSLGFS